MKSVPVTPVNDAVIVNTTTAGEQSRVAVAALAAGGFVVVWGDDEGHNVFGRLYDAAGTAISGEFLVGSLSPFARDDLSVAGLAGGGFVVTWQVDALSNADIVARRYDSAGNPLDSGFLVNSPTAGEQLYPRAIGLAGGGFLVTWDTFVGGFEDIRGQSYDASGAPVGSPFLINATTAGAQGFGAIAPIEGGGFVAVWQSVAPPGSGNAELVAQRFDASGGKLGGEFQITSSAGTIPFGNDVAVMSDGSIVFSWIAKTQSATEGQVFVRRFDASGLPLGTEFAVFTGELPNLSSTSVSALANGAFVVSWVEYQDDVSQLLARAFDSAGAPLSDVMLVSPAVGLDALTIDGSVTLADGSLLFGWSGGNGHDVFIRRYTITADNIDGTVGNDTLNGTTGDDVVNALAGADQLFLQQGGDDRVEGGAGNDGIFFGSALTGADAVNGGAGVDTLALQGNYGGLTVGIGVVAVEVLLVLPGSDTRFGNLSGIPTGYVIATRDANVAAGAILTVQAADLSPGENLSFNGSAESDGRFRIFAGRGVDSLVGGAGSDGFFFGAAGNLSGADRIDGGAGIDSIALRGNYVGLGSVQLQSGSIAAIEVVTFLSGHTNEFGGFIDINGFDYDVTLADGNIAADARLDIIATNLRANESARVDARAELDGSVRILTGAGDDILFGSANADVLSGGLGTDAIDGGGGADRYIYRAIAESTPASTDSVVFAVGDQFDLSTIDADTSTAANDSFTFIGPAAFGAVAGQLRAVATGAGQWAMEADVDGDGIADLAIAVATSDPLGADAFIL